MQKEKKELNKLEEALAALVLLFVAGIFIIGMIFENEEEVNDDGNGLDKGKSKGKRSV
jgi:hypothetical protein